MKNLISLYIFSIISLSIIAQNEFDPKIILLLPNSIEIEKGLEKKINFYEQYGVTYQKEYLIEKKDSLINDLKINDTISLADKEHFINQINFASELNFVNSFIWNYARSFHNILNIEFENSLVIVDTNTSFYDLKLLHEFSKTNNADYIINIDSIIISKYKRHILFEPTFTVYYQPENRIIRTNSYFNDQYNKSYITVERKTLNIYKNDMGALSDIYRIIKQNGDSTKRKSLKAEYELKQNRISILDSLFHIGKSNETLDLKGDSLLNTPVSKLITTISSPKNDKCLAFFAISKNMDIENFSFMGTEVIVIYLEKQEIDWLAEYLQKGVMKVNKLTLEENARESFMSLIDMEFFKEGGIEQNKDYWEKELFKKYNNRF